MDQPMSDASLLKTVAERGAAIPERKQLQRFDWLQRALELFVAEGIEALRITRLADDLNVTRGSFYWHFANREELIDALVSFWKDKNTPTITRTAEAAASLEDGILRFFETCVDTAQFDPRLDLALREWARRSAPIRELVDFEDRARIDALRDFYSRFGYPAPDALIRARVLYYSQIGFYALEVSEPLDTHLGYTESYYECFTGQKLGAAKAESFRRHIVEPYAENVA
jgi:AcrR family transcriptional regulator